MVRGVKPSKDELGVWSVAMNACATLTIGGALAGGLALFVSRGFRAIRALGKFFLPCALANLLIIHERCRCPQNTTRGYADRCLIPRLGILDLSCSPRVSSTCPIPVLSTVLIDQSS